MLIQGERGEERRILPYPAVQCRKGIDRTNLSYYALNSNTNRQYVSQIVVRKEREIR